MTNPLAALIAGLKVKPLVWEVTDWSAGDGVKGENDCEWTGNNPFNVVYIIDWLGAGEFRVTLHDHAVFIRGGGLDAAKAAAQADYEARIMAALEVAHHVNETPKSEHDGADVLTALPADVAGVVEEAGKVLEGTTPGPWMYRPNKYDDWGVVKADDFHLCQVRDPNCYMTEDLDAARAAKVDPWETNARFIAWCREGVPALLAQNAALRANTVQALDEKDREYNRLTNDMIERHAAQIAGLTKERDDALHFLDVAVSKSPEPLKALGSHLAALLDEDDWPTAERFLNGAVAAAATLRAEVERLRGGLDRIDQWADAYPLEVFAEPDFAKADEVLKTAGLSLSAISASNMRHVIEGVKAITRAALGGRA